MLISYCRTFDINYRILRLCNVYGEGDKSVSEKRNALQYLIGQLRENRDVNLYFDGRFYRDYLHVDDVCLAIDLCINKAPIDCIINIGSGEKTLFRDLMNIAKDELDSTSKYIAIEPPKFHKPIQVKDIYMDTKKLKSLGFVQNISIEEGVRALCCK
jgi:dTDP-glucose 4,6-dehydratase